MDGINKKRVKPGKCARRCSDCEHGKFQFINCLLIRESNAFTKYGKTLGPLLTEVSGGAGPVGPREC
jgi:hypothetical protein